MGGSGERRLPVCGRAGAQAVPGPAERTGLRRWHVSATGRCGDLYRTWARADLVMTSCRLPPLRGVVPVLIGDPLSLNLSVRMVDAPFRSPLL